MSETIVRASNAELEQASELSKRIHKIFRYYSDQACFGAITLLLVWSAHQRPDPKAALESYISALRMSFETLPPPDRGPLQ